MCKDYNCYHDICPGNICPGDICPYQQYKYVQAEHFRLQSCFSMDCFVFFAIILHFFIEFNCTNAPNQADVSIVEHFDNPWPD